jgi:hypothetical protein
MRLVPQTSIDERTIEDGDLEAALEKRERAKATAAKARKVYTEADEDAKARITRLEVGAGPVRVGRFVIASRTVEPRLVSFETGPSTRITIALAKEDE